MAAALAEKTIGRDGSALPVAYGQGERPSHQLDPASFEHIYREHHPSVWRLLRCLGVPASVVDDAAQECFLVVHRRLAEVDTSRSLRPWVFAIARRIAWRVARTNQYRARLQQEILVDEHRVIPPDETAEHRELLERVGKLLDEMPLEQREVFVLTEFEDLTAPQIAALVEAPLATVYSRLRLARARFQRLELHDREAS